MLEKIAEHLTVFDLIPITQENYMDVWDVYKTNNAYFLAAHGKNVEPANILQTWGRLVDGYDASRQLFFGLWQDGTPLAVIELLPHFPEKQILWFSEIIIHVKLQRSGLATKIVQAVIKVAQKDGQHVKIHLGVGNENPAAKIFWQKMGFTAIQEYDDGIVMQITLD
ncbi:MAG: GNAT family N-acetyltransferase [Defluviitaleaceae bacterium]|nr:GNAT family N-acetyltransferase [Defluviitaleaceae bacterium]